MSATARQSIKIYFREQSEYTEYIPVNGTMAIDKFNTVTMTAKTTSYNTSMLTKTTFYYVTIVTKIHLYYVAIRTKFTFKKNSF